jgi:hypothetical protein
MSTKKVFCQTSCSKKLFKHIDITLLNRIINGTYQMLCFAWSELLVATKKIYVEEQALVAVTKQNSQADKVARSACSVLGLLVLF